MPVEMHCGCEWHTRFSQTPLSRTQKKSVLIQRIRFHDLRHTCATLLLSKSIHPKIVQEILDHSTISITPDTYSHVLPNMQEKAIRVMDELLE